MNPLTSFLSGQSRPFLLAEFAEISGLSLPDATAAVQDAINHGRLVALPSGSDTVYLASPGFTPRSKRYYDFRPDAAKLRTILDVFTQDRPYRTAEIAAAAHMPHRTTQRYIATLVYMGCLARTTVLCHKHSRYIKQSDAINPLHIPFFFSTVAPTTPPSTKPPVGADLRVCPPAISPSPLVGEGWGEGENNTTTPVGADCVRPNHNTKTHKETT